jgi:hypothetical protein
MRVIANRLQLPVTKNPAIRAGTFVRAYFINNIWRARLMARFKRRW